MPTLNSYISLHISKPSSSYDLLTERKKEKEKIYKTDNHSSLKANFR